MRMRNIFFCLTLLLATSAMAAEHVIDINAKRPASDVSSTMYGIFFEDINYGADGGLYAEMVKNRSFEFPETLMGWQVNGPYVVMTDGPFERNPHYLRLEGGVKLENEGFFSMAFQKGKGYRLSLWARAGHGETLAVELIDRDHHSVIGHGNVKISSAEWTRYTIEIRADREVTNGSLRLALNDGMVDVEHVSLFPVDTWMGHENGMRRDLAEALADLHPGVFRFPGGCIIEGNTLATRYQWKNSVGPVENRPLNSNRWLDAMPNRLSPDYFQSLGLGFYEYFLLAEEIGATPLPVLNAGMACEFVNDPTKEGDWLVPLDQLQPYIDDALDLIEFANGDPATNKWAALRAEMGHPAPFNLHYLAIGNEQWGEWFAPRLERFADQIRKRYPDIVLIGTAGPSPEGEEYDRMWGEMRRLKADLVDEHYYNSAEWFLSNACRYDKFDRKGPKVFAGEYACHTHGICNSVNCYSASLAEAAFMTGLERNADVVRMATYAPLFAHVDGWQWRPDMIWFDNHSVVRTASYYVQQLFSANAGTHVLSTSMKGRPVAGLEGQDGLYVSSVLDKATGDIIVKIVNTSHEQQPLTLHLTGAKKGMREATLTTLSAMEDKIDNSIDAPHLVEPKTETLTVRCPNAALSVAPRSVNVLRFHK